MSVTKPSLLRQLTAVAKSLSYIILSGTSKTMPAFHQASAEVTSASPLVKSLERKVTFYTCGDLFRRMRRKSFGDSLRYMNAPAKGLPVEVTYVDTAPTSANLPTVLAIHGVPGNYSHFNSMIEYFAEKPDLRLIALNLPDFGLTRAANAFLHSTDERYQFCVDFLQKLNVDQLDCLISHSAGNYVASSFWTDPKPPVPVKSHVLLNPPRPTRQIVNWRSRFFAEMSVWPVTRGLVDLIEPHSTFKKFGLIMDLKSVDEFHWLSIIVPRCDWRKLPYRYKLLGKKQTPTLYLMAEKDKLIPKRTFMQIANDYFKAKETDFVHVEQDGSKTGATQRESWIRVLNVKNGGHMAHIKFANVVNPEIDDFIKSIINSE